MSVCMLYLFVVFEVSDSWMPQDLPHRDPTHSMCMRCMGGALLLLPLRWYCLVLYDYCSNIASLLLLYS